MNVYPYAVRSDLKPSSVFQSGNYLFIGQVDGSLGIFGRSLSLMAVVDFKLKEISSVYYDEDTKYIWVGDTGSNLKVAKLQPNLVVEVLFTVTGELDEIINICPVGNSVSVGMKDGHVSFYDRHNVVQSLVDTVSLGSMLSGSVYVEKGNSLVCVTDSSITLIDNLNLKCSPLKIDCIISPVRHIGKIGSDILLVDSDKIIILDNDFKVLDTIELKPSVPANVASGPLSKSIVFLGEQRVCSYIVGDVGTTPEYGENTFVLPKIESLDICSVTPLETLFPGSGTLIATTRSSLILFKRTSLELKLGRGWTYPFVAIEGVKAPTTVLEGDTDGNSQPVVGGIEKQSDPEVTKLTSALRFKVTGLEIQLREAQALNGRLKEDNNLLLINSQKNKTLENATDRLQQVLAIVSGVASPSGDFLISGGPQKKSKIPKLQKLQAPLQEVARALGSVSEENKSIDSKLTRVLQERSMPTIIPKPQPRATPLRTPRGTQQTDQDVKKLEEESKTLKGEIETLRESNAKLRSDLGKVKDERVQRHTEELKQRDEKVKQLCLERDSLQEELAKGANVKELDGLKMKILELEQKLSNGHKEELLSLAAEMDRATDTVQKRLNEAEKAVVCFAEETKNDCVCFAEGVETGLTKLADNLESLVASLGAELKEKSQRSQDTLAEVMKEKASLQHTVDVLQQECELLRKESLSIADKLKDVSAKYNIEVNCSVADCMSSIVSQLDMEAPGTKTPEPPERLLHIICEKGDNTINSNTCGSNLDDSDHWGNQYWGSRSEANSSSRGGSTHVAWTNATSLAEIRYNEALEEFLREGCEKEYRDKPCSPLLNHATKMVKAPTVPMHSTTNNGIDRVTSGLSDKDKVVVLQKVVRRLERDFAEALGKYAQLREEVGDVTKSRDAKPQASPLSQDKGGLWGVVGPRAEVGRALSHERTASNLRVSSHHQCDEDTLLHQHSRQSAISSSASINLDSLILAGIGDVSGVISEFNQECRRMMVKFENTNPILPFSLLKQINNTNEDEMRRIESACVNDDTKELAKSIASLNRDRLLLEEKCCILRKEKLALMGSLKKASNLVSKLGQFINSNWN